jgi:hypothetical protein
LLRDAAVRESHYNLTDLHGFEERIIAHLDGLSVAGDVAAILPSLDCSKGRGCSIFRVHSSTRDFIDKAPKRIGKYCHKKSF